MNTHFITIAIITDTNLTRDDMIDYFTTLLLDSDVEQPFDLNGLIINSSRTSIGLEDGVCVYGKVN